MRGSTTTQRNAGASPPYYTRMLRQENRYGNITCQTNIKGHDMNLGKAYARVIAFCREFGYRRATVYLSPDLVVSACRVLRKNKRDRSEAFVVKVGKANYLERKFIKQCKKANEPFPIKKVQLKNYPPK